jgi:hypothetical protein
LQCTRVCGLWAAMCIVVLPVCGKGSRDKVDGVGEYRTWNGDCVIVNAAVSFSCVCVVVSGLGGCRLLCVCVCEARVGVSQRRQ